MLSLNHKGLTLIEVMIAAAILVVIMAIIYGSFSSILKTMEIAEERGESYRKTRLILNKIAQEISCAYLPQKQDLSDIVYAFKGEEGGGGDMPRDTLHFISTAHPLKGYSTGLKEVSYYITTDQAIDEPVMMIREDTTPDDHSDEGGRSFIIGKGISGLDFTYYDAKGRDWNRWDSTSPLFKGKLPTLVRISILIKDKDDEVISLTTMTHIPLGRE